MKLESRRRKRGAAAATGLPDESIRMLKNPLRDKTGFFNRSRVTFR
jgi:hypothetical protein